MAFFNTTLATFSVLAILDQLEYKAPQLPALKKEITN